MKRTFSIYFSLFLIFISAIVFVGGSGCANIIPPVGGPRDSLPPVLVSSTPKDSTTRFTGNRVVLIFNEFVEVQNVFENVLISPTPTNVPNVSFNFRTVTVRLKDTLEPNTTYSINFGNAIKDVNEGNIAKEFTYVFSTGRTLDQDSITGKVVLAQTGKIDSTLIVVLHRNLNDSAIAKEKPRYIAKLDGRGNFHFRNLPAGTFAIYAIPNDFSRHYDDTTRPFAFANTPISSTTNTPITLYAYTLAKQDTATKTKTPTTNTKASGDKKQQDKLLKFQTNLDAGKLDILKTFQITFNHRIIKYDSTNVSLTDKTFKPVTNYTIVRDTGNTRFSFIYNWPMGADYHLLINKNAFTDSAGVTLVKNDTIPFSTKREEEYGSVRLSFKNLDLTKNPVIQIVQNDKVIDSAALTTNVFYRKVYTPGEYEIRILYDTNKNGKWDAGRFFGVHIEPEIVVALNTKVTIRGNWDNGQDITL